MGIWLLIKILFILWGAGLIGAGVIVDNPQMASAARGAWFGVNMVQIGVAFLIGAAWAGIPKGLTITQQIVATIQQLLYWPKLILAKLAELWKTTPTA